MKRLILIFLLLISITVVVQANPDDLPPPDSVTIAGTVQSQLGCSEDWQPPCEDTFLTYDEAEDVWKASFDLTAGSYEYKAALNGSWDDNYGAKGEKGGANIPLVLEEDMTVEFVYDHNTGIVSDNVGTIVAPAPEQATEEAEPAEIPEMVNVPGSIQSQLGCEGDWQPDCEATLLEYNAEYDVWSRSFDIPAGEYEYKVAINGAWTENYGAFADQDGGNIILNIPEDTNITFVYDHKTNWISDNVRHIVATVPGSFQSEIGCSEDWQVECLRSWLQDVDGDGIFNFTAHGIPAGDYEAKVALNLSWDENYGADGELDGANIAFSVEEDNTPVTFTFDSTLNVMVVSVGGGSVSSANLNQARAYWVSEDTIVWDVQPVDQLFYTLLWSEDASLDLTLFGLAGQYRVFTLAVNEDGLSEELLEKFPHLAGQTVFTIADADLELVPEILKGQFAISASNANAELANISSLQIPGVLDDLYTYDGDLGVTFNDDGVPTIRVWAPTARSVQFHLFDDSDTRTESTVFEMALDAENGVWSVVGEADWLNKYYLYEVEVFAPTTMQIEHNMVTDPYSYSLSMNGLRTQIVDLNDASLQPSDWDSLEKPALDAFEDIAIYELHIRDFSAFDETVPEEQRGTYLAFTNADSNGMQHLSALADAGLTHLHLLPTFDIATINENKARHFAPDYEEFLAAAPNDTMQQAEIDPIRDLDAFNWGYDPFHYTTPEGSYSTNPDSSQRILEYREMVQAVNEAGLRLVMDVVYNHTNASGQAGKSVLDQIVPGYYHRLDANGQVARSTCCANTATEHNMMRKLMLDSLETWATAYKVDGFRFDLMGHHMLSDMVAVREMLDSLTLEDDGVDGAKIYVYGEGWNFGEVADNARGVNATQLNIGGTGIGVFNDRLRDAARGGNPFGDYQVQGFITGLSYNSNGITPGDEAEQLEQIRLFADQIRVGLVGNLRDYTFEGASGSLITGADVDYNGSPAGYTLDPQENIVYVSAHDNETLFDAIQYKAPADATVAERVRMQNMGISIVGLSQGIPFYHAGIDMLRSKSFDRDSYNSGDWFNRLDFTYETNNFGVGLPPAEKNETQWNIQTDLLANEEIVPSRDDILDSVIHTREILQIRQSSPLFRLETAQDIQARVAFHNTGANQVGGLIVMSISDVVGADLDPDHALIVVVFNARNEAVRFTEPALRGFPLELHPLQVNSHDEVVQRSVFDPQTGNFSVPAQTTAVFILPQ